MKHVRSKSAAVRAVLENPELVRIAERVYVAKCAYESADEDFENANTVRLNAERARYRAHEEFKSARDAFHQVLHPITLAKLKP